MSDSDSRPEAQAPEPQPTRSAPESTSTSDPLRASRTSGLWIAVAVSGIVLVLLIIFIAQNTDPQPVRFLGWEGEPPMAVSLLVATAAGLFLATIVGSLRILQLRRRIKRESR